MPGEFDEELLATAVTRKAALAALADEPHHREELETALDVSKTTCHRIVRTFDDQGLLRRTDSGYGLTPLGDLLYELVDEYEDGVRLAYRLQPLITELDRADIAFDLGHFENATITEPEPGNPYPFAERTMELFHHSETIRVVDCNPLVPPVYVEKMLDVALETDMQGEFILPPELVRANMEQFEDRQRQVAESDGTSGKYLVHDDITFGLALYDAHLDIRVYDDETGTPVLYVDTDDSAAIDWAEDVYERYRSESRPATELDEFPAWAPDTGIDSA